MGGPARDPLKDDIPARQPPVVTFLALAAAAWPTLVAGEELAVDGGGWTLLVAAAFLWLFGPSVEDAMGQVRFAVFLRSAGGAVTCGAGPRRRRAGVGRGGRWAPTRCCTRARTWWR